MSSPEKTYIKADNPFGLGEGEVPTIEDVAKLIVDGKAKRILIMVSTPDGNSVISPVGNRISVFDLVK